MFGKEKKGLPAPISIAKTDGDDLGRFPAEVDNSPSRSRSQERALRAVSIVAIVSGMMNVALIMLVFTLFPLQKVYPYLVTFKSQDNQVVSIDPMNITAPSMQYVTEDNVRDYVVQRHSFVPIEATMKAQWGVGSKLWTRTIPELYQTFADPARAETQKMLQAGFKRSVDITSVQQVSADTWQVNFLTTDAVPTTGGSMMGGSFGNGGVTQDQAMGIPPQPYAQGAVTGPSPTLPPTGRQTWIATMRVAYQPQRVTFDKRLLNPLGFTVTDYSVARSTGN